jgi:hypothetical protein
MSASEHVSPRLFHGTGHTLATGEQLEPRYKGRSFTNRIVGGPEIGGVIFATPDFEYARGHAGGKVDNFYDFNPVYEVPSESFSSMHDILTEHAKDNPSFLEKNPDFPNKVRDTAGGFTLMNKSEMDNLYVSTKPVTPTAIVGWGKNTNFIADGRLKKNPLFHAAVAAYSAMTGAPTNNSQ